MLITMFTDASFSSTLQRGTWAAWAKAEGTTQRFSGVIKRPLKQSGDAEIAAIANGLHCACRALSPPPNSKFIIQTDSAEAICAYRTVSHARPYCQEILAYAQLIASTNQLTLEFRHVKGHKGNATPRHAVNTWCDREARKLMGALIREAKNKATTTLTAQNELSREQEQLSLSL
jgi:ribonuclease HI